MPGRLQQRRLQRDRDSASDGNEDNGELSSVQLPGMGCLLRDGMRFNGPTNLHTLYRRLHSATETGFHKIMHGGALLHLHQLACLEHGGVWRDDQNMRGVRHVGLSRSYHSRDGERYGDVLRKRYMHQRAMRQRYFLRRRVAKYANGNDKRP